MSNLFIIQLTLTSEAYCMPQHTDNKFGKYPLFFSCSTVQRLEVTLTLKVLIGL